MAFKWISQKTSDLMGSDGSYLLFSRAIQLFNGFMISIVLVKVFGLEAVGLYTVAAIAVIMLSLLCTLGLQYALPQADLTNAERNTIFIILSGLTFPLTALMILLFAGVMAENSQEFWIISLFATGGYFGAQVNVLSTLLIMEQKTPRCIIPPLTMMLGIIVAAVVSQTLFQFALILLLARLLANCTVFLGMKYSRVAWKAIWEQGKKGAEYIPMDFLAMLSDQIATILSALLLTRADLGIFGLCRQVLNAANTPGWTLMQAYYPKLVETKLDIAESVGKQNLKLSTIAALFAIIGSAVLGFLVYEIPQFWWMCVLLALSLPARYLNNFYDQVIRAMGHIKSCNWLATLKLLLSLIMFPVLINLGGLWGAILGLAVLSLVSAVLYRQKALPLFPPKQMEALI